MGWQTGTYLDGIHRVQAVRVSAMTEKLANMSIVKSRQLAHGLLQQRFYIISISM